MLAKHVFSLVSTDWHSFDAAFENYLSARYIYVYINYMQPGQYIGINEIDAYGPLDFGKSKNNQ